MTEIFRAAMHQAAADKVIDRHELQALRALKNDLQKQAPRSEDAQLAARTLKTLDSYSGTVKLNQPMGKAEGKTVYLDFELTPTYAEKDRIPGKTPLEIVANISQGDSLSDTRDDNSRCAAATLINAYLLLGGDFTALPAKLGLKLDSPDLTYENVHRLQEALYQQANVQGGKGLNISDSNRYDWNTGRITRPEIVGESRIAATKLGLTTHALMGSTRDTMHLREQAVKAFIAQNPKAPMYVTVAGGPPVSAPADLDKYNHAVTIHHENGKFYLFDTGVNDNGASRAMRVLSAPEVKSLLYENKGYVFGLTLPERR